MKKKQIEKPAESFTLTHDAETGQISLNGKVVGVWDNDSVHNYPEDLTWSRDISDLVRSAVQAGYDLAKEEIKAGAIC